MQRFFFVAAVSCIDATQEDMPVACALDKCLLHVSAPR